MKFDRNQFFDGIRGKLISQITQQQVNAIEFLLGKFETTSQWSSLRHIAYAFATIAHETAWTFRPIKEYRSEVGSKGRKNQDRYWLTGFYGRGYVQLTWKRNYERASDELGFDFVTNPSAVMEPEHAFDILTRGMFEGWFTGKDLNDYITATQTDYYNARRIINGEDEAQTIANYAKRFEAALRVSLIEEDFADLSNEEIDRAATAEPQHIPPADQPESSEKGEHNSAAVKPQAEAPIQNAEAIVNLNNGSDLPANFEPTTKMIEAPPSAGMLSKGWKWLLGLGLIPTTGGGLVEGLRSLAADGSISWKDAIAASKEILIFLLPYLFWVGLAFIAFWGIKEVLKQLSFMVTQWTMARGDMNNVFVRPVPKQPVFGSWRNVDYGTPDAPPSVVNSEQN